MKQIGIIGGMSWQSSAEYYRHINEMVERRSRTELTSAEILMRSVNFADVRAFQTNDDWEGAGVYLGDVAENLENAGADCVLIATNTMHKVADQVEQRLTHAKLINIVDAVAMAIQKQNIEKVGLLGTTFTMQDGFYVDKLKEHGIEAIVPGDTDCAEVSRIIFDELCQGKINNCSREKYLKTINALGRCGAEGVILGCTEIPLLVKDHDTDVELFDTTRIHAQAAVDFAFKR